MVMSDGAVLGIPLLITGIISVDLAFLAWRRSELPSKRPFILLMGCVALLAVTYLMELTSISLSSKLFWNDLEYISVALLAPLFLLFTVQYVGKGAYLNWKTTALLFAMSAMTLAFLYTNDLHHLFYRSVELVGDGSMMSFAATYGPWFYVHLMFSMALIIASFVILLSTFLRSSRVNRKQIRLVMVGEAFPIVALLVSSLLEFPLNLTTLLVLAFLGSGMLIFLGSFRYEILDVMPLALDTVIERMTDGAIVIDKRYRVIYTNPSASTTIGRSASEAHLKHIRDVVPELSLESVENAMKDGRSVEVTITRHDVANIYDVRATELNDQAGVRTAMLLILRDVTEDTQMRESLKRVNTRINIMSMVTRHATLDQVGIIRGYSEILSGSHQTEANVHRYAERIKEAVKYIEHQFNFTMEYQSLGSSERQWQWAQYVLAKAKTTGVSEGLKVESDLGSLTVLADPLLEKVFTILLDNTRQHAKGAKNVKIDYRIDDGACIITYQDDGPGIPLIRKENIFVKRDAGSDSLGLFIARQIMEMSEGDIREVGGEGEGARFELIFPEGQWNEDRVDNLKKVGVARSAA